VLAGVRAFATPVPYKHPYGAITWMPLDEPTAAKVWQGHGEQGGDGSGDGIEARRLDRCGLP
jgi:hypothetical protein